MSSSSNQISRHVVRFVILPAFLYLLCDEFTLNFSRPRSQIGSISISSQCVNRQTSGRFASADTINFLSNSEGAERVLDPSKGFCIFHTEGVPENIYSNDEYLQVDNISRLYYYEHGPESWQSNEPHLDTNFTFNCPQLADWSRRQGAGTCCHSESVLYILTLAREKLLRLGTDKCDTCHENLMNIVCRALCHPRQSLFAAVTEVVPTEDDTSNDPNLQWLSVVRNVTFFVEDENLDDVWKSCKDVENGKLLERICDEAKSTDCGDPFSTLKSAGMMQFLFPFYYTLMKTDGSMMFAQPAINRNIGTRVREYQPMLDKYVFGEVLIYDCEDIVLEGRERSPVGCPCKQCHQACLDGDPNKGNRPESMPLIEKNLVSLIPGTDDEGNIQFAPMKGDYRYRSIETGGWIASSSGGGSGQDGSSWYGGPDHEEFPFSHHTFLHHRLYAGEHPDH